MSVLAHAIEEQDKCLIKDGEMKLEFSLHLTVKLKSYNSIMKFILSSLRLVALVVFALAQTCPPGSFTCNNGNCVRLVYLCDGYDDCGDMSDEPTNPDLCPPCEGDFQWRCANGRCIGDTDVCNGQDDCGDQSDEPSDPSLCPCRRGEFKCDNGNCVPNDKVCDEYSDCEDGSDERQDCPPCSGGNFRCDSEECIGSGNVCDAYDDCLDGSDEKEETCPCSDDEVRCTGSARPPGTGPPGECIPDSSWCDGNQDCRDGSDETNCTQVGKKSKIQGQAIPFEIKEA